MEIENISFEVKALLGKAAIPLTSYLGLQVGDIIVLDQPLEERLTIRIGQQDRFRATAGLFKTHKAITLDERVHT